MTIQLKTGSYISLNPQFKSLTVEQVAEFKQHARENHKPFEKVSDLWHPVWRAEAKLMNEEECLSNTQYTEDLDREGNYYDTHFMKGTI